MKRKILFVLLILLIAVGILAAYLLIPVPITPARNITWGASFTKSYAQYLGLDWRTVYLAMLDDLKVKAVRIGVNWDEIAPGRDEFAFDDYDWMFQEAAKKGVDILPVVGLKLPRWPECRSPRWADSLSSDEFIQAQFKMIETVVNHFKVYPNVKQWQMENEAFIEWFGNCPVMRDSLARAKVKLVRQIDSSRPIVMTESGELSSWLRSAFSTDILGISLYRRTWNKWYGYSQYFFPPSFYAHKAKIAGLVNCLARDFAPGCGRTIITELQMEVWSPVGVLNEPLDEQLKFMNAETLRQNAAYAKKTGFDTIYTWGVEWWWWMKQQGHPELWQTAKEILSVE